LQNGIHIDNINLPNLKVKQLYIKWNKNININIDEITINTNPKQKKQIDYKNINQYFKKIILFDNWFEQITINKIIFNDITASFKYKAGGNGYLNAKSKNFSVKSSLFFESNMFNININSFHDYKRNIDINGNIIFNAHMPELTSNIDIKINNEIFLNVLINANEEKLFYKIDAKKNIKNLNYIAKLFKLDKRVSYWFTDAIKSTDILINSAHGWFEYKKIDEAYKNFHAIATLKNLNYTYDKKLDAIHTKETVVEFKDGILNIKPHNAYTYGFFLDKSWLKIDFTKKQELLSLYLMLKGAIDKNLIFLLKRYNIKLPVIQNSGTVNTNLKLSINLRTLDVEAHGDFFAKKANFNYLGLDIDTTDTYMILNNFNISIKNMLAKYKDIATAKVTVDFNAKKNKGIVKFKISDINFKKTGIKLDNHILNASYNISPKQDTLSIDKSTWSFYDKKITLDKVIIPVDLSRFKAQLPVTIIKIQNIASAYISGDISLKSQDIDLNIDLLDFKYKNIKMAQSNIPLKITYKDKDKNINIKSTYKARIAFGAIEPVFDNISIDIKNNKIFLNNTNLIFEDIAKAKLSGFYSLNKKEGLFEIKNLTFKNKDIWQTTNNNKKISFSVSQKNQQTLIDSKEFDLKYISNTSGWKLKINSLKKLSSNSKELQKYHIKDANITIFQKNGINDINFTAHINYPYKILVKNNTPVKNYTIKGILKDKTNDMLLNINKMVNIKIKKDIEIEADNIGINLNDLLRYFSDNTDSTAKKSKNIFVKLHKSYLWISKDRHVVSDSIQLQYFNKITTAQLTHRNGKAGFKFDNGKFHLYGENFNDNFMQNLFALSKFKNGKMSFSMNGTIKEYDGIFYIDNTTMIDYKLLNNILAFIDTAPSLVTFSLPEYNKNGLKVRSAYATFHSKDHVIKFTNMYLDSKEMDIAGKGTMSFKKNEIDLVLNLKSNLGSSINKIPVVGYILLGDDTVSTSLSITGKLSNPKIKSLLAKEIIVAPLNIIKRTLHAPFNIFTTTPKDNQNSK